MNSTGMPDIPSLMTATVDLLHRGVGESDRMREQLAVQFKLGRGDQDWKRFVNHHAWALVRLQAQGRIRKIGPGRYEFAAGIEDLTPPIREAEPLPKWARVLISAANQRNAARFGAEPFHGDDLVALWKQAGGHCMLTGLPFRETAVGTGRARRPYAPSLDRIDSREPYSRRNCRLVLQAVNFALNAFGDDVFLAIAEGAIRFRDTEAGTA
jgi:hypothetical protein